MGSNSTPHEVRVEEARQQLAEGIERPAHPSVAHVNATALNFVKAAEHSMEQGCPLLALYQIGVAEGIATALRDVVGFNTGTREHAILSTVLRKMMEIRLAVAKSHPESPRQIPVH